MSIKLPFPTMRREKRRMRVFWWSYTKLFIIFFSISLYHPTPAICKSFLGLFQNFMVLCLCSLYSQRNTVSWLSWTEITPWIMLPSPYDSSVFSLIHHSHYPVTACLVPICSLYGAAVTTVEGVGSIKTRIHPVQVRVCCDWHPTWYPT